MALSAKARQVIEIAVAHKKSAQEISDTVDAGIIQVLTTDERDALTPSAGKIIFNSTTSVHQGFDGSIWNDLY